MTTRSLSRSKSVCDGLCKHRPRAHCRVKSEHASLARRTLRVWSARACNRRNNNSKQATSTDKSAKLLWRQRARRPTWRARPCRVRHPGAATDRPLLGCTRLGGSAPPRGSRLLHDLGRRWPWTTCALERLPRWRLAALPSLLHCKTRPNGPLQMRLEGPTPLCAVHGALPSAAPRYPGYCPRPIAEHGWLQVVRGACCGLLPRPLATPNQEHVLRGLPHRGRDQRSELLPRRQALDRQDSSAPMFLGNIIREDSMMGICQH